MAANIETSFLAGTAAWWGSDVLTEKTQTAAQAFRLSRLDWEVEKRPVYAQAPDGTFRLIEGRHAVTRITDDRSFGVVGDEYRCAQNIAQFDFLDGLVDRALFEAAGSLRGGSKVYALLNVLDSDIDMGGGDIVKPYILATTTHDGSGKFIVKWVTRRVVCENTLDAALGERGFSVGVRHSGDMAHKLKLAQQVFAASTEAFAKFAVTAHTLQQANISRATYNDIVNELFPEPKKDENGETSKRAGTTRANNLLLLTAAIKQEVALLPQFTQSGGGVNAWMLLNGFTRFADHSQKVQLRKRNEAEVRLEHGLLGGGDAFKTKAAQTIMAAAGIKN